MKLPQLPRIAPRKRKLRAAASRNAALPGAAFEDMSEPNMKLSRALLIVLVLHVVAVAGIIAFNAIKSRQGAISPAPSSFAAKPKTQPSTSPAGVLPRQEEIRPMHTVATSVKNDRKTKGESSVAEGTKHYVVARGDTPVSIAKKFKVPYDDLLAANHIDDPRKLKIGQKLIIPARKSKKE